MARKRAAAQRAAAWFLRMRLPVPRVPRALLLWQTGCPMAPRLPRKTELAFRYWKVQERARLARECLSNRPLASLGTPIPQPPARVWEQLASSAMSAVNPSASLSRRS